MEYDIPQATGIDGLTWTPKKVISDARGAVMHMLKEGQFDFPVGEIYFSLVKPGVVKGWKLHKEMWQRFAVPLGRVQFVFVDQRTQSKSKDKVVSLSVGPENFGVITGPPGVWYSFKNTVDGDALIVNAPSIAFKPHESVTEDLETFRFHDWQ